jgi:hypothetical protein
MARPSVPARSDETRPALPHGRRGRLRAALAAPALYALSSARSSAAVNAVPDLPEREWPARVLRAPTRAFLIGGAKAGRVA